jgi:hypothetical protein
MFPLNFSASGAKSMKKLFIILLSINCGLMFPQNIELISGNGFQGAIFPSSYLNQYISFPETEKRFTPSKIEVLELERQLKSQIKHINKNRFNQGKGYGPIIHKRLRKYNRQYMGLIDPNGQRVIHVNFIWNGCHISEFLGCWFHPDITWKTEWQMWMDGGSRYWNINYIIDKKDFVDLWVNGLG